MHDVAPPKKRIRLRIEYAGTNYHGWQSQRAGGTIQDLLENHLSALCKEDIRITGASRTDAGVHAMDQIAAFTTASTLPADTFRRALNARLPRDIRILAADDAHPRFHPRYDAAEKQYLYLLSVRTDSAFLFPFCWTLRIDPDLAAMEQAAAALVGEHDYSAFRGSGCSAKHPVRTVREIEITRTSEIAFMTAAIRGDFLSIRITANAFLRHMARTIVGTLVEVGKGRIAAHDMERILLSKERSKAGPTAPAQGLFLEKITY